MDEEIIQRIVYIIVAIIFFIAFSKKKKTAQNKEQPMEKKSVHVPRHKTITSKSTKQETNFPPVEEIKKTSMKNTFTTMTSSLGNEVEDLELIEDEVNSDHRIIKKKVILNEVNEKSEPSFKVSHEDLKKAVILSEIIRPKYF
ncbi:MAG: hypothetical protein Fur0028_00940 [Bacteroidales bacterium]